MGFNINSIVLILGKVLVLLGLAMILPLITALVYNELPAIKAFCLTILPSIIFGSAIVYKIKPTQTPVKIRDGFLIVATIWLLATVVGAIPFTLSGSMPYVDALFETSSGFTTTGASIMKDVEILPMSILFWRSFTHWLGGLGIVIFAIALMPQLNIGGFNIVRAETPGPSVEKLSPKLKDQSRILFVVYMCMTLAQTFLLKLGGLTWFDSLVYTFGSVGTGGFAPYNDSAGHFEGSYVPIVITIFMIMGGANLSLYYTSFKFGISKLLNDSEFRCYMAIIGISVVAISVDLISMNIYSPGIALRESAFQVGSIITTTGYATVNYDLWPTFAKCVLFSLYFCGGCSGSTGGGPKVIRILVLLKFIRRGVLVRLHPNAIIDVKLGGKPISADVVSAITGFAFLYLTTVVLSGAIISLDGYDLITSFSASFACIGNVGPGFNLVGPVMNYSIFSDWNKLLMTFLMLAGRLEFFTLFMLFTPRFWNKDR